MDVIPVIDIKNGEVVHAQGGRRDDYRPIRTPLSPTSAPQDVALGLLGLFPFRQLYIADLDAISGAAPNVEAVNRIAAATGVELWVDTGESRIERAQQWLDTRAHSLVVGSESQRDTDMMRALARESRVLLSLDFRGDAFVGPPALRDDVELWPARVIVMTLARVGAASGPDLVRISSLVERASGVRVYAAGGVRNSDDLAALTEVSASGVLVATALHTGALTRADLERFAQP